MDTDSYIAFLTISTLLVITDDRNGELLRLRPASVRDGD